MALTKTEILENIHCKRRTGFTSEFDYSINIRGFHFETMQDRTGELYEEDETGKLTFVSYVNNKRDVVKAVLEWFTKYASQEFDY